ncbi:MULTISPECIES: helix-turn-helix domain-containing protein [Enterococcus]|uniref:helix-turn-helix domain-containing protein n=1 Tax=Enterococcus TaxID=1350 RepID=UPI00065DFEB4|nr:MULTISPECIES: helix-turn-helix domain-containing protein [Enterococcus]EMF0205659.1 helix-turn-helix domain-containing protein [Enterococcus hirae]EGO8255595.1 helix-turn-helix domain-containing protein [Enterococcus faecalis]EGO8514567.1 DNA-binding protein [Enterococcus faecalis]EGO9238884.1 DNA-binding protein [Enterococcus faecalis]ELS0455759.1 helix-turn-helix domain-containing protein [Enterococcus faecalis]
MELEVKTNVNSLEIEFYSILQKKLEDYTEKLLAVSHLPLVLTNADLKRLFQISDSTLNRLVKLGEFPPCWYGIRGHYFRDDVLEWMRKSDSDDYCEQLRILRSL